MAYDIELGDRVRATLKRKRGIAEKNMFGGLAFLVGGKMFCGVLKEKLVVRVGPEEYRNALSQPYTSKMDFTGKPLTGYVYVGKKGVHTARSLTVWVEKGLSFTKSLLRK